MECSTEDRTPAAGVAAPRNPGVRNSRGAKAAEAGSVRRARLALSGLLALALLFSFAQWEAAWGSDTTLVSPSGPIDQSVMDRIPQFDGKAPRALDGGYLGGWLVLGAVTGSPNATFDVLYDGVGAADQFETIDTGLSITLRSVLPSARPGSTTSTALWQKGLTSYLAPIRHSTSPTGFDLLPGAALPDELSGDIVHADDGKVGVFVRRNRTLDVSTELFGRRFRFDGSGLQVGAPQTLVDVGEDEFIDEPSVLYLPISNTYRVAASRGPLPFDNTYGLWSWTLDRNLQLVGEADRHFQSSLRVNQTDQSQTGSQFAGLAAKGGDVLVYTGLGPWGSWSSTQGSRASVRPPEIPILGPKAGAFYHSPRLAPAGHDSLIAVGMAAEPPSFRPTVKAQLIHGDGSLGAVATFDFGPDLQPVTAVPIMGYRNELLVSLADTSVPVTDSGVVRLPLTITTPPCQASDTVLCLNGGRFKVELSWRDTQGRIGVGHTRPLTGDTGAFSIFDPANLEVAVKVLDAQVLNDHFWVFVMGLTDVGIGITVTDTETGHFVSLYNVLGRAFPPYQNTQALPGDNLSLEAGWINQFTMPYGDLPIVGPATDAVDRPRGAIRAQTSRGSTAACVAGATKLCLAGGRFEVSATFETAQGQSGAAQTVGITADSGYLWFFDQDNVEALIKVLDACVINQRIWVFAGGLTDVKVVLTVRDSVTGQVRTYTNPLGTPFQPVQDTGAFATCS